MRGNIHRSPLPKINERRYLMNQSVIVVSISSWFELVKIRYENEATEFFVDAQLLCLEPDNTPTISLDLLGGTP